MTTSIMYKKPNDTLKKLAKEAFGYEGNTFKVTWHSTYYYPQYYWSEGSIRKFVFVSLVEGEDMAVSSPPVEVKTPMNKEAHDKILICPQYFILEHEIAQGKDKGIVVYFRPDSISEEEKERILKESEETIGGLSINEQIVLAAHLGFKSTYQGIKDFRKHEAHQQTSIKEEEYETAKQHLKDKKLLTARNAVTIEGKNLRGMLPGFYRLKQDYESQSKIKLENSME